MVNKSAEFESTMNAGGSFEFRILLKGGCSQEELKKIQNLFNKYLKLTKARESA